MPPSEKTPSEQRWKLAELRKLPPAERSAILARAAELAYEEYLNDPSLTAFEAFGEDDIFTSSANDVTVPVARFG